MLLPSSVGSEKKYPTTLTLESCVCRRATAQSLRYCRFRGLLDLDQFLSYQLKMSQPDHESTTTSPVRICVWPTKWCRPNNKSRICSPLYPVLPNKRMYSIHLVRIHCCRLCNICQRGLLQWSAILIDDACAIIRGRKEHMLQRAEFSILRKLFLMQFNRIRSGQKMRSPHSKVHQAVKPQLT